MPPAPISGTGNPLIVMSFFLPKMMPTSQIWCQLGSILGALGHPGVHFGQCFEVLGLSFRFGRAQGMHKWIFQRFCVSFGIHLEQFFESLEALGAYFEGV